MEWLVKLAEYFGAKYRNLSDVVVSVTHLTNQSSGFAYLYTYFCGK